MESWIIGKHTPSEVFKYLHSAGSETNENSIFCFDYFDTLIVRDVAPEFTKYCAAEALCVVLDNGLAPEQLYEIRHDLEKVLCDERYSSGGELEFYLPDFAPRYLDLLRNRDANLLADWDNNRFVQLILDIELSVELRVQKVCPDTVAVLEELKSNGGTTVLISDFYLPSSHFLPMLEYHGLAGKFDHVYISADHGCAKGSGRIYNKIISELGCKPQQFIMIGDNPHSDVKKAKECGMQPILLENPKQKQFYINWRAREKADIGAVTKHFSSGQFIDGLFQEMGFSLWLFISKLFDQLLSDNIEHVFFFSKEGEFLKKLFDCYQRDIIGHRLITSHYLLVSRKATFLASLKPLEGEDFSRLFNNYSDISLRDFLLSLNLEESVALGICKELGLDYTTRYSDLSSQGKFKTLISSETFQTIYEKRRSQQRRNLLTYLDSFGVNYRQEGMNIVDVGWKGSIQDNLFHALEGTVSFRGHFIGSLFATCKSSKNMKTGLLFDDAPSPSPFFNVFNNNRSLFEMVLGATHGSADGYFTEKEFELLPRDHGKVITKNVTVGDNTLYIATLDLPEERKLFNKLIQPLQTTFYEIFVVLNRTYALSGFIRPDLKWFAKKHARMVFSPSTKEIDFFESLYHLENFGIFEYTNFLAGQKLPVRQRLENLKKVITNRSVLESGIWPPIILRRLGVGKYRFVDGVIRYYNAFYRSH